MDLKKLSINVVDSSYVGYEFIVRGEPDTKGNFFCAQRLESEQHDFRFVFNDEIFEVTSAQLIEALRTAGKPARQED